MNIVVVFWNWWCHYVLFGYLNHH